MSQNSQAQQLNCTLFIGLVQFAQIHGHYDENTCNKEKNHCNKH